jgi:alkylation response protein AidB-like acyl-CoA dehydrogenase
MSRVLDSGAELERFLGDPCDPRSVLNYEQSLRVDEDEAFPAHAVEALNEWGLPEFYVPALGHGGRFARMDEVLYVLRAVARRDITVAIAHAKTFLGSVAVWVGASPSIQARCADLIRAGHLVSLGLTEFEHGGDLVANGTVLASSTASACRLNGVKWLINNATRCAALTVYANHASLHGTGAGTLAWVEKSRLDPGTYAPTPKIRTAGVRGADISGIQFRDAALSDADIIGKPGQGLGITLRSLQLSRTLCCGLSIGAGDMAVRTLAVHMQTRSRYRKPLAEYAFGKQRLGEAFLRQLIAECLAFSASRMVHVAPRLMSVISSVAKYMVPELVDSVYELCEQGLGARAYLRVPPWSQFQKAKRDHRLIGLFDGSTIVNLQCIALQLSKLMNQTLVATGTAGEGDALNERLRQVFDVQATPPELAVSSLSVLSTEPDLCLRHMCRFLDDAELQAFPPAVAQSVGRLREAATALEAHTRQVLGGLPLGAPEHFDAARRYAEIHAAASCFYVWRFNWNTADVQWDPCFVEGAWVAHAIDWLLSGDTGASMAGDLHPWLQRQVENEQAISFQPLTCPHASVLNFREPETQQASEPEAV